MDRSDLFGPDLEPTPCEHGLLVCDECEAAMARDAALLDPDEFYQSWRPGYGVVPAESQSNIATSGTPDRPESDRSVAEKSE